MINSYRSSIERITRDKANLEKELAREQEKISRLRRDIAALVQGIAKSTTLSSLTSKQRSLASKEKDLAHAQGKVGSLELKVSQKMGELHRCMQNLERAEEQERKKQDSSSKNRREAELRHVKAVTRETARQANLGRELRRSRFLIDVSRLPEKIKVLFVAANPLDQDQLRLDEEIRSISEKIRASDHRDAVELVALWAARPADLLQGLNQHKPHIVHFSGHGSDRDELLFQGENGETKVVSMEAMVTTISTMADNIRLVFFNACFSEGQAEAVTAHVETAIGMAAPIGDEAARVFAAQFYSALGFGHSIQTAFDQGRAALLLEGSSEANTPQLFVREGSIPDDIILVRPPNS